MQSDDTGRSMNQLIFNLGLATETISVYLLCCGLSDEGITVRHSELERIWNGNAETLAAGLSDLTARNILVIDRNDSEPVYHVNPVGRWRQRNAV